MNQTNYVQAKETTQKICLYLGQKITLADLPEGEVVLSKEHVVEANKVVTTIGAGTVTISVKTKAETVDYAEIEVKKNEILSDLSFNRQSFTAHPLGGGSFQLPIPQFESMTCVWQARTPETATGNYYAGSRRLCRIFCYGYGFIWRCVLFCAWC